MKKIFSFLALALITIGWSSSYAADYYVAGNGAAGNPWCNGLSWQAGAPENKLIDGTITFKDVPAGVYEFKITDGTWANSWGDWTVDAACSSPGYEGNGGNVKLVTAITQDITITFDGSKICVKGEFGAKVEITSYTLVGDKAVFGTNWDTNDTNNDLEKQESGKWILTKSDVTLPIGEYAYKVVGNHSYSVYEYPSGEGGNKTIAIDKAGVYDIVFSFDPAIPELVAFASYKGGGDLPEPEYYLEGFINGADYTGEDYKFVEGKLSTRFTADSYVYVKSGTTAYFTETYVPSANTATAVLKIGAGEKMGVSGNKDVDFTLQENEDGTLTLSYVINDVGTALDNLSANEVRYTVQNGELRLAFAGEQQVAVRSLTGQMIDNVLANSHYTRQLQQGIYILTVGQTNLKVVVK